MADSFTAPYDALQPSQLYLCDEKLLGVLDWFDAADTDYNQISVAEIDGDLVILDGHHRMFVARLAGADDVHVVRASDDTDLESYRTCISWCTDAGIETVDDLAGRVLDREGYEKQWIRRCRDTFGD